MFKTKNDLSEEIRAKVVELLNARLAGCIENPMTRRAASARPVVPVGESDHALGPETALVTLVEHSDYQCPACGQVYPIIKEPLGRFGRRNAWSSGTSRWPRSTHMPRVRQRPRRPQGRFWPMRP
jgi:hypothetical protein